MILPTFIIAPRSNLHVVPGLMFILTSMMWPDNRSDGDTLSKGEGQDD